MMERLQYAEQERQVKTKHPAGFSGGLERCHSSPALPANSTLRSPVAARTASGFTLIETLVAMAIIITIAAIAIPNLMAAIERAKVAKAVGDIHSIGTSIIGYEVVNQKYPDTLNDVGFGGRLDPWGNPYQYLSFANVKGKGPMRKDRFLVPINNSFDLYSMGPDGKSAAPLTAKASKDDVIWANDGSFIGLAADY
ncbi:MAG: prepilin-type N-terminal cleavage/methylation domain-containing protein [Terriglobales bacterium]